MSKARDLANFGDDISDGVISAALDGDGSALTGLSAGATEVVSSGTASNVASIDFTGLDLTTYDYKIALRGVRALTSFQTLYLSGSVDGLSSRITGYAWGSYHQAGQTQSYGYYSNDVTNVQCDSMSSMNTYYVSSLDVNLSFAPSSVTTNRNVISWTFIGPASSSGSLYKAAGTFTERYSSGNAVMDSITFYLGGGNMTAEEYTLYRTVKS